MLRKSTTGCLEFGIWFFQMVYPDEGLQAIICVCLMCGFLVDLRTLGINTQFLGQNCDRLYLQTILKY